ncbi:hypothetical protein C7H19_11190 [Aphanothece hegewaldii CCALA 016]|uniref:Gamma-glutamylcyclotransferase AIG2-like domain-containing protein n=1 Tax=Aphanothece hegewaldii CCALA 016 TaxID=2107694 RepID=A0A2T1LY44_9CHRO|nr:gamma-glutamylcyclotransferase family protein [Aphanothece hegewaldii]PSF37274.1 hypothetical protein C7H19_11190 [Aphanothece hegewaldii CCALA 016]
MQVFVYGTLKPGERNYPYYCEGKTVQEREAYTKGKLFHLSLGYPGLLEGEGKVKGILLTFSDKSVLEKLDELEDYHPLRSPHLNEYQRKQIQIFSLDDEFLGEVWGYVMTLEKIQQYRGKPVRSGCWTEKEEY